MAAAASDNVPWRLQCAVYGVGLFSTSMFFMSSVVVPLWLVTLEPSPFLVGLVLGSRHLLPMFLSIHGGALMDRLGGRRVMLCFAALGMVVPALYPALPWVWAVLVLQMIGGLADSMGWLGAQTLIGQMMRGRAVYTGRLSFSVRFGHLAGPPLIGAVWDAFGPWPAFMMLALWGAGVLVSAWMLPSASVPVRAFRPADLVPRPSEYLFAFRLLATPTIALVVMIGMMMHVGNAVQSTFYVVYLGGIGISGTSIGLLLAASSVFAAAGSLVVEPVSRRVGPYWLMLGAVLASVLLIAATPLLGTFFLLLAASALRGGASGLNQPLLVSTVLRAAGPESQGKAVGLRGTANRVASIVAPVLMGTLAEFVGIETSFYLVGAAVTVLMALIALHIRRTPALADGGRLGSGRGGGA